MVVLNFTAFVGVDSIPDDIKDMLVIESVKDSIAAQDNEVMEIRLKSELRYFWLSNDDSILSTIF